MSSRTAAPAPAAAAPSPARPDLDADTFRRLQEALGTSAPEFWAAVAAAGWPSAAHPMGRTRLVIDVLGGTRAAARSLGVAPSQVSRWASGETRPGPDQARRLLDLDHVIAQAQLLWGDDEVIRGWLTSHNDHLGARPIDVVTRHGSGPVVDAIRAEVSGAYA